MTDSPRPLARRLRGRPALAIAGAALLGLGGAVGAVAVASSRPSVTMAPATPVPIRTLADDGIVTIRGQVAERFGNKFVMADPTGRALVDLGREGDDAQVAVGQQVTVQGRFDDGFVHASFLVGADGKVHALGPLGGGRHHGPHGTGREDGPDGPPPPPPPSPSGGPAPVAPGAASPVVAPAPATAPTPSGA